MLKKVISFPMVLMFRGFNLLAIIALCVIAAGFVTVLILGIIGFLLIFGILCMVSLFIRGAVLLVDRDALDTVPQLHDSVAVAAKKIDRMENPLKK